MNKSFNYEVNKIIKNAEKEMLDLRHPYVGTEHLLLSLLQVDSIANICERYHLTYETFKRELINIVGKSNKKSEVVLFTPLLKLVLDSALTLAKENNKEVDALTLMSALLTSDDGIALRILMGMNIDIDKLYHELSAKDAITLSEIGTILNDKDENILVGREKEITNIMEILLRKNKNNPILIGECGVGKSAIVYELARKIKVGDVPDRLKNKKIISVDMASLLSNTKYRGEFETKLNTIIKEVMNNKDIILFIDEIHTIVKSGGGEGSIDAANILKPYLASADIKVIGATTTAEYDRFIAKDKALSRRFEKVLINEPNDEATMAILKGVRPLYEQHHGVKISDENIFDIVALAHQYIFTNHNPDKSLDVLDYVCSRVVLREKTSYLEQTCEDMLKNHQYPEALKLRQRINHRYKRKIKYQDILSVIESITNIKIYDVPAYEHLCKTLDELVMGQNLLPLKEVLKRKLYQDAVLSLTIKGPAHVGKTYTAKIIADTLGYNLIELDMHEFSSTTAITKLIGSNPGYVGYEDENIFDQVKHQPYSLLLLKNIECAALKVQDLFKSIINEGTIKNNRGEIINFNNAIIIMTSEVTNYALGYQNVKLPENDVINYDYIPKTVVKKYLLNHNVAIEKIDNLNEVTNFQEIMRLIKEVTLKTPKILT